MLMARPEADTANVEMSEESGGCCKRCAATAVVRLGRVVLVELCGVVQGLWSATSRTMLPEPGGSVAKH